MATPEQTNEQKRRLEVALQHWVERILHEAFDDSEGVFLNLRSIMNERAVALGGGLAAQTYLSGEARNKWSSFGMHSRYIIYCKTAQECETVATELSNALNSIRKKFSGKPHASWFMLCASLANNGIDVGSSVSRLANMDLFAARPLKLSGKLRWTVALSLSNLGRDTDLAVIRMEAADKKLLNAVFSDAAVVHPRLDIPIIPLNLLIDSTSISVRGRLHIVVALLRGHVTLLNEKAYDFALRAASKLLNAEGAVDVALEVFGSKDPEDDSAEADGNKARFQLLLDEMKSYTLQDPSHKRLYARSLAYHDKLDILNAPGSLHNAKTPGRYADMKTQVTRYMRSPSPPSGGVTGLSVNQLLTLYSVQSSRLNVACMLSGIVPELESGLMSETFTSMSSNHHMKIASGDARSINKQISFRDYMNDMDLVFEHARPPRPIKGTQYKELVLFRAVDLFELKRQSVFNRALPFDIVNHTLCSTSVRLSHSTPFLKLRSPCCMLRIRVPASYTRMLAIKPVSGYPDEEEVLFPRGSVFTVRGRRFCVYDDSNVAVLDCDVRWEPVALDHRTGGGTRMHPHRDTATYYDLSAVAGYADARADACAKNIVVDVLARRRLSKRNTINDTIRRVKHWLDDEQQEARKAPR